MMPRDYYGVLEEIHSFLRAPTYLEIGVRHGQSWKMVGSSSISIGIDPAPQMQHEVPGRAHLFKGTSDDFFEQYAIGPLTQNRPIWLSFIDGMHLFEYALRDFINCERAAHPQGAILIHDCLPIDEITSSRERKTSVWSGDVYKLVLCLKKYRPDLAVVTVNTPPTGLGIVRGLDPTSTVLHDHYERIVDEFKHMSFAVLGTTQQKEWILNVIPDLPNRVGKWFGNRDFCALDKENSGSPEQNAFRTKTTRPEIRKLGVLLCYNDADILEASLQSLLESGHHIIAWNHGSTDSTSEVLAKYSDVLVEHRNIPRSFDFYRLYEAMSENLIKNHCNNYDWVSWPDQDEILEGPDRSITYADAVADCMQRGVDWIQFDNFNFWFTEKDDLTQRDPIKRIQHYALFADCAPRIRSWRASRTNIRHFNHNAIPGRQADKRFALRHYPMRSLEQAERRILHDRAGLARSGQNYHYDNMRDQMNRLRISASDLHFDDGHHSLRSDFIFDWRQVYGHAPESHAAVSEVGTSLFSPAPSER